MKKLMVLMAVIMFLPSCADANGMENCNGSPCVPFHVPKPQPSWTLVLFFGEQPGQIDMDSFAACRKAALALAPANKINTFHSTPTASCISSNGEVYSTILGKMVKH